MYQIQDAALDVPFESRRLLAHRLSVIVQRSFAPTRAAAETIASHAVNRI